jgi:uncharacterized FlgJ-related protein
MLTNRTINFANRVYNAALGYGANENAAKIITAQAMNESGNFTSSLFSRSNNAFGMNMPTVRKHNYVLGKDKYSNYAAYKNVEDSTRDLIDWLNYNKIDFNNIKDSDEYVSVIKSKNYFTAPLLNYQNAVKNLLNQVSYFLKNNSLMILAVISLSLFIIFLI